jgi:hypothetical protein
VEQAGTDTANHIKYQEPFGAPIIFQDTSEHPKGKHVEKNMFDTAMKEEVSDELMRFEEDRMNVMQCEKVFHVEGSDVLKCLLCKKNQYIYNDEVLYYGRDHLKSSGPEFCHDFFLIKACKLLLNSQNGSLYTSHCTIFSKP